MAFALIVFPLAATANGKIFYISLEIQQDTIPPVTNDTIPIVQEEQPTPLIADQIDYSAKESVQIDRIHNKLYLYDQAELYYQDTELKAGIIVMDFKLNEVYAGRIPDSAGNLVQAPSFKQADNLIYPDSIRYNFDTEKALIWNSKSGQNGMDVFARLTKKENDSIFYLRDARVSTAGQVLGNLTEGLDYYFRVRKAKVIPGKQIITGFANMIVADIPTPLMVPFAYFPTQTSQESGFLFPSIGESVNQGFHIQNGGYHFALSDYYDLTLTGDYYTNGSFGIRTNTQYIKRYKFSGNFSFRYEKNISEERGFPNYSKSSVFNVRWSHRKDRKSNPSSNFSASVNFGSSNYFRESLNQLNSPNFLNNDLSSSIAYTKTFPAYPRVNLSFNANLSQNSRSMRVNLTLPSFQGNLERIFPFAPRTGSKSGILQNINFQYSTKFENRIITDEDKMFKKGMFDDARYGATHTVPISTNFKVLKYLSVTVGSNIKEVWTPTTIRYQDFDIAENAAIKDTISGFDRFTSYNISASVGTTIYGTVNFGLDKKIQSIRHTMRPSISYSQRPSSERYYDTYIIDANGNTADYTRFEGGLFGAPSRSKSNSMNISISNLFEAKVRDRDSTATEPKKITLIKNLNISTSYNFNAEEFKLAPIRMTAGFDMIQNKLGMNLGATFDPYALDENNVRIPEFNLNEGGGLLRLTSLNANFDFNISSDFFKSNRDTDTQASDPDQLDSSQQESAFGGGRSDDLFGRSQDFTNRNFSQDDGQEAPKYPSYRARIPWDLRIAYTLTYLNSTRQRRISNNSLMFSGNVNLTPKWQVGISSGYDFEGKGFTYTQFRFERDLDSWRLNFDWVPFSDRASWYFFIGIKSGLLKDIKYEKRREPDRRF
ncbi:MAG: putative LPS assembly protein LptD [Flavobacteriaceae bacterium]|nr:putative LPS assembly protein LptD [Flavobacteriaceae bacterium]